MSAPDLQGIASQAAQSVGLDPAFYVALVGQGEHGFTNSGTSPAGASGPAQLMPGTAQDMGVQDITDPAQNLAGGARYAKMLWDKYDGDPSLVAAAYNAGPGAVDKHGGVPPYKETQAYVQRVTNAYKGSGASDELPSADDVMKAYGWSQDGSQPSQSTPLNQNWQDVAKSHNGGVTIQVGGGAGPAAPAETPATSQGMPSPDEVATAYGWAKPAPDAPAAPQQAPGIIPAVTGFMANVNRGLGIGDELAAGFATAGNALTGKTQLQDIPAAFSANMAHQRQLEDAYSGAHPTLAALGRGTGNALTLAAPVGPGAEAFAAPLTVAGRTVAPVVANALRGATLAGASGAAFAAADAGTPEERLRAAADAATPWKNPVGYVLGAGAGALGTVGSRAVKTAPPTLDELAAARDAAYKAVDNSGVRYTPEAFQELQQSIAGAMDKEGFNSGLHGKASAMLQSIGASDRATPGGYAPTLTQLDQLRQQIGRDVASSPDAGERRMGQIMRGQIDKFIGNATPEQLMGGANPAEASALIQNARNLNTRVQKLQSLDEFDQAAADRAAVTGSGTNGQNTLRQNVLRFRDQTNNLTPEEAAAADRVIQGTKAGNALRKVGKLSPGNGGLMANGQMLLASLTHGASVPVGIAASVAKAASDAITSKNVQALRNLIATGGQAATEVSRQLADPQYADLRRQLANDLAVQAGVQEASRKGSVTAYVVGHPELGAGASSR